MQSLQSFSEFLVLWQNAFHMRESRKETETARGELSTVCMERHVPGRGIVGR